MIKFLKITLFGLFLLHSIFNSSTEEILNNLNVTSEPVVTTELSAENVIIAETSILPENEGVNEKQDTKETPQDDLGEQEELLDPVTNEDIADSTTANRTGRQLFYSPTFFYIQNFGAEGAKCLTSRGLVGVCMGYYNCVENQRKKRQLPLYGLQQYPQVISTYLQQQQPEVCTFYDQYARASTGVCCTGISSVKPVGQPLPEQPQEPNPEPPVIAEVDNIDMMPVQMPQDAQNSEDSEVLEADLNSFQPEPPKYDNTDFDEANNIGYDPIDNLKQAPVYNPYNNYNNYIRYPWPQQFLGFSGVQQWPPPVPTHAPTIGSWPPPLPTHPPNHHYPTHPPFAIGGAHFTPVATTSTRRPSTTSTRKPPYPGYPGYPSYPTYRPISTITTTTTTTTTTKKPSVSGDSGGSTALGLPLQCGLKSAGNPDQERIVGGTNASPHEFPWITVLFKSGKQFCGGSLITNNHILTAAHCVAKMTSWDVAAITAHMGDYNIRTDFEVKHVERRIKRLVRHKGFDFSTLHNDIAILTLNEPVQFTTEIQPICLPTSSAQQTRSYSGHVATVAGWGSLRENGPQPSILQKVSIPIWTNSECAQKYGRAAPAGIIDSMICAGQAAKDSCSGDSGGPLIINDGGRFTQVGIVSWGIGCGKGQYPGVYTRVTSLLPWIYKNIK